MVQVCGQGCQSILYTPKFKQGIPLLSSTTEKYQKLHEIQPPAIHTSAQPPLTVDSDANIRLLDIINEFRLPLMGILAVSWNLSLWAEGDNTLFPDFFSSIPQA